ncbi:sulfate/molybdate ABC transporter ATP-binding protein [Actinokineospora xionganensis]|uniref:sulfate/molybdate ABC transporter ATP-binding protein n=1 Tax=Actinokineospora xionganensis TaxID=2684470 RepID=UPI0035E424C4
MTGLRADFVLTQGDFRLQVDLRTEPGEVIAVLGPNGSGKSTLLDVLAGLRQPDSGVVAVDGMTLTDTAGGVRVPPHRRGVGLLAQVALLFPHLTALANVEFGPRVQGKDHTTARRWLDDVGAGDLADRRPRGLSGGQAQRVALARALAADPVLLLLDEPFAALDVDAAPALRGVVRRVLRDRAAVLVTHDPLDALAIADRVVVLAGGRVVEQGPTREVLSRPRTPFTARVAGLDLVAGTACPDGLRTVDGALIAGSGGAEINGEPAVAVFRPADVAVYTERIHGSPRNVFEATVTAMEPHGDVVRIRVAGGRPWVSGLAADLTVGAVAELTIEPGSRVYLAVKATEVRVHPAVADPAG